MPAITVASVVTNISVSEILKGKTLHEIIRPVK
jgi:hypothetical protein